MLHTFLQPLCLQLISSVKVVQQLQPIPSVKKSMELSFVQQVQHIPSVKKSMELSFFQQSLPQLTYCTENKKTKPNLYSLYNMYITI